MFIIESDRSKRLVVISVAGHVTAKETKEVALQVREKLEGVGPRFVALTDFRWLDSMATGAAPHIGEIMDTLAKHGVASVVRVIPDPHKDIGLNILSQFHYGAGVGTITFETLADALQSLIEERAEG